MRKLCAALVALMLAVGGLFAEEIKGALFVKAEGGKATFKVEDKEVVYKYDESMKIKMKKKGGDEVEVDLKTVFSKAKEGDKYDITTDDDKVTIKDLKKGKKK